MKPLPLAALFISALLADSAAEPPSLYERVAKRLAGRADLATLGQPPPELAQVDWLLGEWEIEARVTGEQKIDRGSALISRVVGGCWLQTSDTYPTGTQDLGFLTYNPVTKQWLSVGIDSTGNVVKSVAAGWEGNRLVFLATDAEVVGVKVTLHQILEKISADEFVLRNEELLPDGRWRAVDSYRYTRRK